MEDNLALIKMLTNKLMTQSKLFIDSPSNCAKQSRATLTFQVSWEDIPYHLDAGYAPAMYCYFLFPHSVYSYSYIQRSVDDRLYYFEIVSSVTYPVIN